jgi:squalene-hopene/tetraprenyl-beta-curcumene cyclase
MTERKMRRRITWYEAGILSMVVAALLFAAGCGKAEPGKPGTPPQASAKDEERVTDAMARGIQFLHDNLKPDGSWENHPGITGIVLLSILKSGNGYNPEQDPFIRKPVSYLLGLQKANGAIYEHELANYCTAIALQALIATKDKKYEENVKKARGFLLGIQLGEGQGYESSDPGYGGVAYSDDNLRADLSNAQTFADAIKAAEDSGLEKNSDAWKRLVVFASRCQNRSESNDQKWASNDGGATYSPWESKAYEVDLPDGRKGLRSYGSMTYAFLKCMIYADVKKDDPRVKAAYEWIQKHYMLDENPQMGQQGLFYYYHTMAKALSAYGDDVLVDAKGVKHEWRKDMIDKLLSLQQPDGSWVNAKDRWWENRPVLVTSYVVLTLEELTEKK